MLTLATFIHQDRTIQIVVPEPYFAPAIFNLLQNNFQEIDRFLPWIENIQNVNDEANFLQMNKQAIFNNDEMNAYVLLSDGQPVGMIDLHNIDHENNSAEIGYWLGKEAQGHGIMTEAVRQLIAATQAELNLHKVTIVMDIQNDASRAIPQRLGFLREARLKDHLYRRGQYHDADVYYKIID